MISTPQTQTKTRPSGGHLSGVSFRSGVPYFPNSTISWIEACTKEKTRLPAIFMTDRPHLEQNAVRLAPPAQVDLPKQRVVEFLMEDYLKLNSSCLYPIIDKPLFKSIIQQAYGAIGGQVPSAKTITARACVFAFTSIASLYCGDVDVTALVDSEVCAEKAEGLLQETGETLDIVTLQTLILLVRSVPSVLLCRSELTTYSSYMTYILASYGHYQSF